MKPVRDHHLISYLHDRNDTRVKVLGVEGVPELNRDEASISDGPAGRDDELPADGDGDPRKA
jgi:hypothetical protein